MGGIGKYVGDQRVAPRIAPCWLMASMAYLEQVGE